MRLSTIPAMFVSTLVIFAILAISNQITDGEWKLLPSLITGVVVGIMNVLVLKLTGKNSDDSEPK